MGRLSGLCHFRAALLFARWISAVNKTVTTVNCDEAVRIVRFGYKLRQFGLTLVDVREPQLGCAVRRRQGIRGDDNDGQEIILRFDPSRVYMVAIARGYSLPWRSEASDLLFLLRWVGDFDGRRISLFALNPVTIMPRGFGRDEVPPSHSARQRHIYSEIQSTGCRSIYLPIQRVCSRRQGYELTDSPCISEWRVAPAINNHRIFNNVGALGRSRRNTHSGQPPISPNTFSFDGEGKPECTR